MIILDNKSYTYYDDSKEGKDRLIRRHLDKYLHEKSGVKNFQAEGIESARMYLTGLFKAY